MSESEFIWPDKAKVKHSVLQSSSVSPLLVVHSQCMQLGAHIQQADMLPPYIAAVMKNTGRVKRMLNSLNAHSITSDCPTEHNVISLIKEMHDCYASAALKPIKAAEWRNQLTRIKTRTPETLFVAFRKTIAHLLVEQSEVIRRLSLQCLNDNANADHEISYVTSITHIVTNELVS